jgi:hypothetical protein
MNKVLAILLTLVLLPGAAAAIASGRIPRRRILWLKPSGRHHEREQNLHESTLVLEKRPP